MQEHDQLKPIYGATPTEWDHFDLVLGLGSDLLPVVSNLNATISPNSEIKGLGKTPSVYDASGNVVGLYKWTQHQASAKDLTRWSRQSDYGICIQTRTIRAIDIDVDDSDKAKAIADIIRSHYSLPVRTRANSGKLLFCFSLAGSLPKRVTRVDGGIVEFLATGQQFIAVGTHPSGARYEWAGGLPDAIPELTLEQFDDLWADLALLFAIEDVWTSNSLSVRMRGDYVPTPDPVADLLKEQGIVHGENADGGLAIVCPWDHEHSTGTAGDGSTMWFPAGTNGYDKGHFVCLHSHCQHKKDHDFFEAICYVEDVSGDFDSVVVHGEDDYTRPGYVRNEKTGEIEVTVENVVKGVREPRECGMTIAFDEFRDEIVLSTDGGANWQQFTDADYTRIRIALERVGFKTPNKEITRDAVEFVARERAFDSAKLWLSGIKWDGVPRVENFLSKYFKVDNSAYVKSVSRYMWSALAGRVLEPGCKVDMVPIFVGAQGVGKSTAVAAMSPAREFFCEVSFGEKETDLARKMRGRLVAELGELRGLRTKEIESIKAWVTRCDEDWTPKFKEFNTTFPRRLVFFGTTNESEFLDDATGNRRWLPVVVHGAVDVAGIVKDRLQLWAEGAELFLLNGVEFSDAQALAVDVHKAHTVRSAWDDAICDWFFKEDDITGFAPCDSGKIKTRSVLLFALGIPDKDINRGKEMEAAKSLKRLGFIRHKWDNTWSHEDKEKLRKECWQR